MASHDPQATARRPRRTWFLATLVAGLVAGFATQAGTASAEEPSAPPTTTQVSPPAPPPTAPVVTPAPAAWVTDGDVPPNPCQQPTADVQPATGSVVPDDCWGRFPSSHYDIGFDEGAWNHLSRKVYGTFTDLAFQGGRSSTAVGLWLVQWAYGFGIYERLGQPTTDIANRYQSDVVGPLGLGHLAWFYAVAWAAVTALRGRLTMAAGELVVSIIAAGLAAVMLANPAGYLDGAFDTTTRISGALLATGTGQPPPQDQASAQAVLAPLQAQIHTAFVEAPYDYLNWGGPLPPECQQARDLILATGPHGSSDDPRAAMELAGCTAQADFNHDPNGTRLFGAVLTFLAALVMVVLLALVAMTIVVAQVVALVLFAVAPFALLAAVLPGSGRELAWRWLAAIARALLAVIGMSFVLSLLLLTVTGLLETTASVGLVERFALINMVVVAMLVARKRILAAGHNLAGSLGQRMATRRVGGERTAPWMSGPAVAGATGFAVAAGLGPDRNARTSRLAGSAGRNYLANRRVTRSQHAADARAERRTNATTTRQRTEIGVDGDGNPVTRRSTSIDGPAPTTRRARAARARVEDEACEHTAAQHQHHEHRWGPEAGAHAPDPNDVGDEDGGTDTEEA